MLQCVAVFVAGRCSVLLVSFDKPGTKYRAHLRVAVRVAVCYSVLQRLLQCVAECAAVRCSVLLVAFDKPATKYRLHMRVAIRVAVRVAVCCIVCCSALQSVLQCVAENVAVRCSVLWVFFCKPSLRYVGCQNIYMNEQSTVPCRVSNITIQKYIYKST